MCERGDVGVISAGMSAKIRRLHQRDGLFVRQENRRTGLSRNTVRQWLRGEGATEPKYPRRRGASVLDAWAELLEAALRTDAQHPVRELRTIDLYQTAVRSGDEP